MVVSDCDAYAPDDVKAARAVLEELAELFSDMSDDLVLVGGWVPPLLTMGADEEHVGSRHFGASSAARSQTKGTASLRASSIRGSRFRARAR